MSKRKVGDLKRANIISYRKICLDKTSQSYHLHLGLKLWTLQNTCKKQKEDDLFLIEIMHQNHGTNIGTSVSKIGRVLFNIIRFMFD